MWETTINPRKVFELRCKNTNYFGIGAINKITDILTFLKKRDIRRIVVVSGRGSYKVSGAWDVIESALHAAQCEYQLYNKVSANPTVDMMDEAADMGRNMGAQAVIAIGGGSPIDTGKSTAVLLEYTDRTARDLYEQKFMPEKAAPIIAVNLTHGTGTEVDRFAVATIPEKHHKPAIAYDCLYPLFAIDDPALTTKLKPKQTVSVTVDALNHITEAATSLIASPYSILTAQENVRLIVRYLPLSITDPENLVARYWLLYASALGGISFDNGMLHLTHALEHPMSAIKPDLPHGLGLAAILPAVVKTIYPARADVLASIYEPIIPELTGVPGEAEYVAYKLEEWLFTVGCTEKLTDLGFSEENIPQLIKLARTTPSLQGLLSQSPVPVTDEMLERIFLESFTPLSS